MRALVVTLCLAMIVAFLVGILVIFGGVGVDDTLLVTIGGALFMVAVLFAAISAIGPKYRPTPALTPIMAGTSAAAVAAAMVLAVNLQLSTGKAASFRASEPQRVETQAEAAEPVATARSVEPEAEPDLAEPPPDAFVAIAPSDEGPMGDVPMDEPPEESAEEPSAATARPYPEPPPVAVPSEMSATATVPVPRPRPRSPSETPEKLGPGDTFTLSDLPFDSSTLGTAPPAPSAAPQTTANITPPLPRSRPCGAGGPPCP